MSYRFNVMDRVTVNSLVTCTNIPGSQIVRQSFNIRFRVFAVSLWSKPEQAP